MASSDTYPPQGETSRSDTPSSDTPSEKSTATSHKTRAVSHTPTDVSSTPSPDLEKAPGLAQPAPEDEEYSEWTTWERRFIVFCAAAAAFFSPLSANIYFPLFGTLADVLSVTETEINLTVTTYMIFQGITPMFVAAFADGFGRRPAYLFCFTVYVAANIGLALQTDYVALALLRCLQSAGSASTVALAKAVVSDIATPETRGRYSNLTSVGIFLGPAIGPVIGGLLAYYLGWRSVFWFLVISAGTLLLTIGLAFPETCRKVVGNGSKRPATWNMSLVSLLHLRRQNQEAKNGSDGPEQAFKMPNFWQTVVITLEKEMSIVTITSGLVFSAFYAITSAVPSLFIKLYGYNTIQIGLCFISVGGGSCAATVMQTYLIDWNYKRHALLSGFPLKKDKSLDYTKFPLEAARLEIAIPLTVLLSATTLVFGWLVHFEVSVAGPLVMLFFAGFSSTAAYSVITVLIIDVHPTRAASATAGNNLVRCLLSAGATAAIIPMMNAMGRGWAFTVIALLCVACLPLLVLCMRRGPAWRAELQNKK